MADQSEKERTKKYVRRLGYVVFFGGGFSMFVAMMIGVVQGINSGEVWDPYTGHRHEEGECIERTRGLVQSAAELDRLKPKWEGRYREWGVRCKDNHPELYELLKRTRSDLQERGPLPTPDN